MKKKLLFFFLAALVGFGMVLAGCLVDEEPPSESTFMGNGTGFNGMISLTVEFDEEGKIISIEPSHGESLGRSDVAKFWAQAPAQAIQKDSFDVDRVTNATYSYNGFVAAGNHAINQYKEAFPGWRD